MILVAVISGGQRKRNLKIRWETFFWGRIEIWSRTMPILASTTLPGS